MIRSMTGFGRASSDDGKNQIHVEIKSLNSKFLDLNLRLPKQFAEKEIEVRSLLNEHLERGKASVNIDLTTSGDDVVQQLYNQTLFRTYYQELKKLAESEGAKADNLFELALNSPGVIQNPDDQEIDEQMWKRVKDALIVALKQCDAFRQDEGKVLEEMFRVCCTNIEASLKQIEVLDPKRVERIRERLKNNVVVALGESGYDPNRLEQEIIFYVEKLDIHEEKVRLKSHIDYFLKAMKEGQSAGKKLAFIAQEIGREINTIGSKSNDAEIQKHVVVMKEELEKIKEQLNNVL